MAEHDKKFFLYQPFIPHYRIPIWKRLNEALEGQLVIIHGHARKDSFHSDHHALPFETLAVHNRWFLGQKLMHQPFTAPFKKYGRPAAIIASQNPRFTALYPLVLHCKIQNIPLVLRGHGRSRSRTLANSQHPYDYIHRAMLRACDAFVCYTDQSRAELCDIVAPSKLFVGRNTLDSDVLINLRRTLETEGRSTVRKRLGLKPDLPYVSYIGRLVQNKRPDLIQDTLDALHKKGIKCGAIIIGDGPLRLEIEQRARQAGLEDIHFTGYIDDWAQSASYLFASDILLNPGHIGLAVNHAFCLGLPIVTSRPWAPDSPGTIHAPEVDYITHGLTGRFSDTLQAETLAENVLKCLAKRHFMSDNCARYAETRLTVSTMIQGHIQAINHALTCRGYPTLKTQQ
ncbi:glycosyltransferase family 4 protein [Desulfovibrio ferrophilus]|uniref:glycosyltransferase family 4 protein n=1 Tax=Desulfovibrio ferrophilus TaxID=241368 RepID=UPI001561D43B|nr:glycosyltransferase [Desulfovibrio ferrophilus]